MFGQSGKSINARERYAACMKEILSGKLKKGGKLPRQESLAILARRGAEGPTVRDDLREEAKVGTSPRNNDLS
jgi:hypothetical protein